MAQMTPEEKQIWDTCAAFHGHVCAGLMIGFKASMYAIQLLELDIYSEEELACISETDLCSVDAIQVVLGCSVGKGNLFFHITGKQAFTFFNRKTGKAVRVVQRPFPNRGFMQNLEYVTEKTPEELFDVKEPKLPLPVEARYYSKALCSICGEETDERMLCVRDNQKVCVDCMNKIDRFHI